MACLNNRYNKLEESFSGGSSDVHIYQDTNLERKVAIKFLLPYREPRRMYDEIAALQRIRSKHVVQIYDILVLQDLGNRVGLVQEYVEGQELAPQTDPGAYLKCLYQIASGIADLHAQKLIHRDIKPYNMKVDDEGIIKIFDFDLARDLDNGHTNNFKGTPGYAAPELYGGYHVRFTPAVDIYAFGVCALFLSSMRIPECLRPVAPIPPQPRQWLDLGGFSHIGFDLPDSLRNLLNRTLEPTPDQRPDMAEIRDGLSTEILKDTHKGLFVDQGSDQTHWLHKENDTARVNLLPLGALSVRYTGTAFEIAAVEGVVLINNQPVEVGRVIPQSCVIGFGPLDQPRQRKFVTFDVSHPEVVL